MKVTGYKIKEAIKAYERLLEDVKLDGTTVPVNHEQSVFPVQFDALMQGLHATQILHAKIIALKKLQLQYNEKVKVDGQQTLANVIADTTLPTKLVTKIQGLLVQMQAVLPHVSANAQRRFPTAQCPQGLPPAYPVPVMDVTILQKAIRKLRMQETKLKNLVGYGNSVELEMEVDETLFDQNRWQSFDAEKEGDQDHRKIVTIGVVGGIVLDLEKMNKMIDDIVPTENLKDE